MSSRGRDEEVEKITSRDEAELNVRNRKKGGKEKEEKRERTLTGGVGVPLEKDGDEASEQTRRMDSKGLAAREKGGPRRGSRRGGKGPAPRLCLPSTHHAARPRETEDTEAPWDWRADTGLFLLSSLTDTKARI